MARLHEELMRVLIADVAAGHLRPGDRLPRETDLADQFGVSRGVARECVRGLEERGLVAVKHGKGAVVRAEREWNVFSPQVLSAVLASEHGPDVLSEYLECRRLLEIEAAGLAAERATGSDVKILSAALDRMASAASRSPGGGLAEDHYHAADVAFHRAIIVATGNRALRRMTEPVEEALYAARRPLARPELRTERSLPEHRRILSAIAAREPDEARAAMREHLLTVEGYLRELSRDGAEARR